MGARAASRLTASQVKGVTLWAVLYVGGFFDPELECLLLCDYASGPDIALLRHARRRALQRGGSAQLVRFHGPVEAVPTTVVNPLLDRARMPEMIAH